MVDVVFSPDEAQIFIYTLIVLLSTLYLQKNLKIRSSFS